MANIQKRQPFLGKVVIITGSSAGIGQAAAIEFAKEGASVVIHGRDEQRLNETEQKILASKVSTDCILKIQGPIEDEKMAQRLVEETLNKFGRIDVLINNAGCSSKPGHDDPMDIANLDHIYNVNMRSIVVLTNLAMSHLEKSRGNVLNVSPGPIADTLITERGGQRGPVEQQYGNSAVLKRLGMPSEVVPAMKLLCSDDGSFITGVCLLIDGGVALCN